jgi:hypothetical protein
VELGSRVAPAGLAGAHSAHSAGSLGGGGLPNGGLGVGLPPIDIPAAGSGIPDGPGQESSDSPTPAWQLQTKRALSDLWNLSCPEIEDSGRANKRPSVGHYPGCSQPPSMPM